MADLDECGYAAGQSDSKGGWDTGVELNAYRSALATS